MPTLAFDLIAGRYHATPWGHLANEGLVEWPPSPWRILRTLLASGFATRGWGTLPDDARRLVSALASVDPEFALPLATASHLRHWMPTDTGRTRVLDPFVAVARSTPLIVHYPCDLDATLSTLLRELTVAVSYLGRAESWVAARVLDSVPDTGGSEWCRATASASAGADGVRLLAPMAPDVYAEWRAAFVPNATLVGRKRTESRETIPVDVPECLLADTARLQKEGWSDPPGSRWVLYTRPGNALNAPLSLRARPPRGSDAVAAVVLALTPTPSADSDGRRGVRPLMSRSLPQAELIHQSAIAALGSEAPSCEVLTGRAADGRRLSGHQHAHYLGMDLDADGRLDHVLVYAPAGLDKTAQAALARVQRTWTRRQVGDLAVRVVGRGTLDEIGNQLGSRSRRARAMFGEGRVWTSVTPFVPPRHMKRTRHTLEEQVRVELTSRGKPAPVLVELLPPFELAQLRFFSYVTTRREGKPQPPARISFGLRITFEVPVRGPIAIGYASHFGLGVFGAES